MNKKVVVGMSGGVDSSVCAHLLKEDGYDVIGVTMQIWQDEDTCSIEDTGGCCGLSAVEDARAVANKLDIPYFVLNFKNDFKKKVIDYFIDEYTKGKTPNPCIACNRYVKWESLLEKSLALGADYIATGHYANIVKSNDRYTLEVAKTEAKDQTYALYNLTQNQLAHTIMPLGKYTKDQVREIAKKINLTVFDKPDSQEICFVPDNDYGKFIVENTHSKISTGNFIDVDGNIIGKHNGVPFYTIGQRKGLGSFGRPVFVKKINTATNEITLSSNEDLFTHDVYVENLNYMKITNFANIHCLGKIRYSHKKSPCTISYIDENTLFVKFMEAQRAITPGQAIVFYDDENHVLGGGTIKS